MGAKNILVASGWSKKSKNKFLAASFKDNIMKAS